MANMTDYLVWRGDLTVEQAPWNDIDSLVMANFCYNDLGKAFQQDGCKTLEELAPTLDLMERTGNASFLLWRAMLYQMAKTERFRQMKIHHYIDEHDDKTQFSAMTVDFSNGLRVVCYRGTDATLVGWKEDLCLSFETVPAQKYAAEYLAKAAEDCDGPIIVVGHSKGGNLAAYAATHQTAEVQEKIRSVCSFDGPGLDDESLTSDGYKRIENKLLCVIPQGSIVGLLLGYHTSYTIVRSTATGIMQHDAFSWQLIGPAFETVETNDASSQVMDKSVHDWLAGAKLEERRIFVDALFSLVEPLGATKTSDLTTDKLRTVSTVVQSTAEMDPEMRRIFFHLLSQLVATSATTAWSMMLKPVEDLLPKQTIEGESEADCKRKISFWEQIAQLPVKDAEGDPLNLPITSALKSLGNRITTAKTNPEESNKEN